MNSGKLNFLEPSGLLQACNGTALPSICIGYCVKIYSVLELLVKSKSKVAILFCRKKKLWIIETLINILKVEIYFQVKRKPIPCISHVLSYWEGQVTGSLTLAPEGSFLVVHNYNQEIHDLWYPFPPIIFLLLWQFPHQVSPVNSLQNTVFSICIKHKSINI